MSIPAKKTPMSFMELVSNNPTPFIAAALTGAVGIAAFLYLTSANNSGDGGASPAKKKTPALKGPKEILSCKVLKRIQTSHNTIILRVGLPTGTNCLGLGAGKHIAITTGVKGGEGENKEAKRSYTPITSDFDQMTTFEGKSFDVLLKVYPEGLVSQRLNKLQAGDAINIAGPTGLFEYFGKGSYAKKPGADNVKQCKKLALIAGGTGITPMMQIMKHVLETKGDDTEVSLVYCNSTVDDVLLYEELRHFGAMKGFNVWFTVSQKPDENRKVADDSKAPVGRWEYGVGRICETSLKENLPAPNDDDVLCLICGPAKMINETSKPALAKLGHKAENIIVL